MLVEKNCLFLSNKRHYKKIVSREDGRGGLRGGGGSTHHYYFSEPVIASSVLHFLQYIIGQYLSNGRDIFPRLSAWRMDQQLCLHLPWHRLAKPSEIPLQQFFTKSFHNKRVA